MEAIHIGFVQFLDELVCHGTANHLHTHLAILVIALTLHDQLPVFQQVTRLEICCQAFFDVQNSFR